MFKYHPQLSVHESAKSFSFLLPMPEIIFNEALSVGKNRTSSCKERVGRISLSGLSSFFGHDLTPLEVVGRTILQSLNESHKHAGKHLYLSGPRLWCARPFGLEQPRQSHVHLICNAAGLDERAGSR